MALEETHRGITSCTLTWSISDATQHSHGGSTIDLLVKQRVLHQDNGIIGIVWTHRTARAATVLAFTWGVEPASALKST